MCELLETGGHHGAFCTSLAEAAHKQGIKRAAQFSRVYRSLNTTQEGMLRWVMRQLLFTDVFLLHERAQKNEESPASPLSETSRRNHTSFGMPLSYTDKWCDMQFHQTEDGSLPAAWRETFLSKKVLISREELLALLRTKLQMDPSLSNLQRIRKHLVEIKLFLEA